MRKYFTVLSVSIKNNTAYLKDFALGNCFILLIITIYILLWSNLYSQNIKTGFTFKELIWYLIINQIVFSNNMELFKRIEDDIKSGNIAYHLNKPYSYPIFMLFESLGKTLLSFCINLTLGFSLGIIFVGKIASISLINIIPILLMMILGVILNLIIYILISLTSFWLEENKPFIWIYKQFVFAFGGFLVPLTLFPKKLYDLTVHLPWTYVSFHTSSTAVKFSLNGFINTLLWQIFYIIFFGIITMMVFKKGADALNVNGG
jgi:ABC-type uncharacterized transport system, permease component